MRIDSGRPGDVWWAQLDDLGRALLAQGWQPGVYCDGNGRRWDPPDGVVGQVPTTRYAELRAAVPAVDPPADTVAERALCTTFTWEREPGGGAGFRSPEPAPPVSSLLVPRSVRPGLARLDPARPGSRRVSVRAATSAACRRRARRGEGRTPRPAIPRSGRDGASSPRASPSGCRGSAPRRGGS